MQLRLLVNTLAVCFIMVSILVLMEQRVSSTTNDRGSTPAQKSPCANGDESGLPLPSAFLPAKLPEFQAQLKSFLTSGKYRTLNWCEDKKLRDTGPFVNGVSYGVHPTVKKSCKISFPTLLPNQPASAGEIQYYHQDCRQSFHPQRR